MAGLEDLIRSSAPGGSIAKPLMLALLALLASGVLFRGGSTASSATTGSQPTSDEGAGGGCCRKAALAMLPIPGLELGKISRSHRNNWARR
jgi:hypothetical protein